jgi:tetratricopeptide (TPR) repeat protein
MALGKFAGAVKYYGVLARAPWPDVQMHGALLEARAYRSDGQNDQALRKYDEVINIQLSTAEANRQRNLALVGRAACQAEMGQAADAIASIEKVIQENDSQDTELFGQAYNALGACHRHMKQTQAALEAYLHVDLLFYQDEDDHAEALYYLSELWDQVKKPERAMAARSLLKSRYPGSRWAKL